jgi:hypothetical protein
MELRTLRENGGSLGKEDPQICGKPQSAKAVDIGFMMPGTLIPFSSTRPNSAADFALEFRTISSGGVLGLACLPKRDHSLSAV